MKRIYWRPKGISRPMLVLISLLSLGGLFAVEHFPLRTQQPDFELKTAAAQLALKAMEIIRDESDRLAAEKPEEDVSLAQDPMDSGLIGLAMTPVTSDPGTLSAKQTSINPNFAAVVVQWLRQAGIQKDDAVAVGVSGSFPALNICVYAALTSIGAKPIVISSAAASQWGANLPDLLWIDMDRILYDNGIFAFRSVAASVGGIEDRGVGMDPHGVQLLQKAIVERNHLNFIKPASFADSIEQRMKIYRQQAGGATIKAYINVGGGTTSVGTNIGKRLYQPGLNMELPAGGEVIDSVMTRFSKERAHVIHLTQIEHLATQYGLAIQPRQMPEVGQGKVFYRREYNLWLAAGVLLAIIACLYALIHTEIGFRIWQTPARSASPASHEPMI